MSNKSLNKVFGFQLRWESSYPLDRWWRKKYSIPFNSQKHRQATYNDMMIDFIEHFKLYNLFYNSQNKRITYRIDDDEFFNPKTRTVEINKEELGKIKNLNLSSIKFDENGNIVL